MRHQNLFYFSRYSLSLQVRLLKAGSLERLVDHLAAAFLHDDVNFLSIFLATYRTFVPPTQVVDMLLERFENLTYEEKQEGNDESYSAADCEAIKVLYPL